ncbi:hypothetical protein E5288_WYG012420 [Bos mutus]|uniref:Uncharacterized protein n=1 Tax=Bos mutus TaxID=72004 RepID=A0A6B0RW15_9CETA|nr:hypothetical protein [Bos mutus]
MSTEYGTLPTGPASELALDWKKCCSDRLSRSAHLNPFTKEQSGWGRVIAGTCAFPLEVTTVCVVVPNSQRHLVAAPQMFNNNMKSTFGLTPISFPSLRNPAPDIKEISYEH